MAAGNISVRFALTGNSPTAQQFFNRLPIPPTAAREVLDRACIDALVTAGTWAKLDAFYIFAAENIFAALANWVSADYTALQTAHQVPWEEDRGFTPDGATYQLSTDFNPTTATSPKFTRNSASLFAFNRVDSDTGAGLINYGSTVAIFPGIATWRVNHSADQSMTIDDATGFFIANRTASNAATIRRNGVQVGTSNAASVAVPDGAIGFQSNNGFQVAAAGIGSGLTIDELTALNSAVTTRLQSVGAA